MTSIGLIIFSEEKGGGKSKRKICAVERYKPSQYTIIHIQPHCSILDMKTSFCAFHFPNLLFKSLSFVWIELFLPFMILRLCLNKSNSPSFFSLSFSFYIYVAYNYTLVIFLLLINTDSKAFPIINNFNMESGEKEYLRSYSFTTRKITFYIGGKCPLKTVDARLWS